MRTILRLTVVTMLSLAGCSIGPEPGSNNTCDGNAGDKLDDDQLRVLEPCCDVGPAHCVPNDLVDEDLLKEVTECSGGRACVPDSLLKSGGIEQLISCTAFGGSEGVCVSRCLREVQEFDGELDQDVCDATEACVPCLHPVDGVSTGACEINDDLVCHEGDGGETVIDESSCDKPIMTVDPTTLDECAPNAHCIDRSLFEEEDAEFVERLAPCEKNPDQLCVPDEMFMHGDFYRLTSCISVDGIEGRCVSTVLPEVADGGSVLPQDVCAAEEYCVPCFDLVDGTPSDVCTLGVCDVGPLQAPRALATCGSKGAGRCVPNETFSDPDFLDALDERNCDDDEVLGDAGRDYSCVSNEVLNNGPYIRCTGDLPFVGDYVGVCLNNEILDFPFNGSFDEDVCPANFGEDFSCTPCIVDGDEFTDAPGCEELYPEEYANRPPEDN